MIFTHFINFKNFTAENNLEKIITWIILYVNS